MINRLTSLLFITQVSTDSEFARRGQKKTPPRPTSVWMEAHQEVDKQRFILLRTLTITIKKTMTLAIFKVATKILVYLWHIFQRF